MSLSLLLLLLKLIIIVNSQLSNSNSQCISNTTTIWCITIHSATSVNYISSSDTIYPNNLYPYFCNDYGGSSYYYYHYQVDQAQESKLIQWPSSTHCFDGTSRSGSCINIASFGNPSLLIGQSNLFNFNKWSINPSTISIPLDKSVMDVSIYSYQDYSRLTITKYQSITQCIEILNGVFPFGPPQPQNYFVQGYLIRSDNTNKISNIQYSMNDPTSLLEISTTSDDTRTNPIFNELFCFASIPLKNKYIHIKLELSSYYNLDIKYPFQYIIIDTSKYTESIDYKLHLSQYNTTHYVNIRYWQRCDFNSYFNAETETNRNNNDNNNIIITEASASDKIIASASATLSNLTATFLITIAVITIIIIIIVSLLSYKCYPSGDPINYFALIWMVLELWDFWSDISFTIYLSIVSIYYPSPFVILLIFALLCVIIPYILNISYFRHITNLWSKENHYSHCCRLPQIWLNNKCYYIYFLVITLLTGGVFPAIELANSILIPHPIFTMRVPYFELVRVRTERFITNVCFENLPFLILQILFYYSIKALDSQLLMSSVGGFVFLGTVLSSVLSVLFSGTYFFSYKGKSALPIAVYSLEITLKSGTGTAITTDNQSSKMESYWEYSIWRMQTAISKAFQVSSPTLIMIDSVDMSIANTFNICCRLLYDEAPFGNQTNIKILLNQKKYKNHHSVTSDLSNLFRKEFSNDSLRVYNCLIGKINEDEGELVYDYNKSLIAEICCHIFKCVKTNRKDRMSTRDIISLHKQNSKRQYHQNYEKPNDKSHIRNVSGMKAAFGKHHHQSTSVAPPFRPPSIINIKANIDQSHRRVESNTCTSNRPSRTYNKALPVLSSPSGSSTTNFDYNKSPTQFSPISPSVNSPTNNNLLGTTIEEEDEQDDMFDDNI